MTGQITLLTKKSNSLLINLLFARFFPVLEIPVKQMTKQQRLWQNSINLKKFSDKEKL